MIQITKSGAVVTASPAELQRLREEFECQRFVRLPEFLEPELLELVRQRIRQSEFYELVHKRIGSNKELCMQQNSVDGLLHFLTNGRSLFQAVEAITGCEPLGCFQGRVYRFIPGLGHHDAWHSDLVEDRLLALSVNLSDEVYAGGVLQIRDRRSEQIISEAPNVGFGDAILFRLADFLQHRVTEVEGTAAKTAFAGWFKSRPDFLALLKENLQAAQSE